MDNRKKPENNFSNNRKPIKSQNNMKLYIIPTILCILIALIIIVSIKLLKDKDPDKTSETTDSSSSVSETTTIPADEIIPATLTESQKDRVLKTGSLVLVNSQNKIDRANVFLTVQSLHPIAGPYKLSGTDLYLTKDAKDAFLNMVNALNAATGSNELLVHTAFTKTATETPTSKESDKEHDAGVAIDFRVFTSTGITYKLTDAYSSEIYSWLLENSYKYGYVLRYPADKEATTGQSVANQFRYVGEAHAKYMHEENLCLEEYLNVLKTSHNTFEKALKVTTASKESYVYYIDASTAGDLQYKTLKNYTVTLSGDNLGGIIVTMTKNLPQG